MTVTQQQLIHAAGTYLVEGPLSTYLVYLITERMSPLLYHFKLHHPVTLAFRTGMYKLWHRSAWL